MFCTFKEYGEGATVSTLGDVYSLGILLLEIFTRRSPTDDLFQGQLDLHKFSDYALPERIWEIADTNMWRHTDAYDSYTKSRTENCLVSVIALGISCSKKQPRELVNPKCKRHGQAARGIEGAADIPHSIPQSGHHTT
ncbi:hypothetical protein EJB05_31497, partial [Eragrostis curvula]